MPSLTPWERGAFSSALILRSGRRPRLEGWGGPCFETRSFGALLSMRAEKSSDAGRVR
jgi:hypothetical protein